MTTALSKITLSASRNIPFNKLLLSQSNVRRLKAGVSVEALAEDIARRTLLQSLNVRPVLDAEGNETGMFEVPAGGRRFRALELLVKQKRMAKTQPVPCVVREDGIAEEDSLAENVQRVALHPLDQFRAFQTLRAERWRWIEVALEFSYGHAAGLRRLTGTSAEVSAEAQARHEAVSEAFDRLNDEYAGADELPEEVGGRLGELEAE